VLAIGIVVDDAIVVLENVFRHMEMGKSRRRAAFDATQEIGFAIVSTTVTLVAVFIPLSFLTGTVGGCSGSSASRWPLPCSSPASSR